MFQRMDLSFLHVIKLLSFTTKRIKFLHWIWTCYFESYFCFKKGNNRKTEWERFGKCTFYLLSTGVSVGQVYLQALSKQVGIIGAALGPGLLPWSGIPSGWVWQVSFSSWFSLVWSGLDELSHLNVLVPYAARYNWFQS